MGVKQLPVVYFNGVEFYHDEKLKEYRACHDPHIKISEIDSLKYLVEGTLTKEAPDYEEVYLLVCWPESQDFMEEHWFENEAVLNIEEGGNYFIPKHRVEQTEFLNQLKSNLIQNEK